VRALEKYAEELNNYPIEIRPDAAADDNPNHPGTKSSAGGEEGLGA